MRRTRRGILMSLILGMAMLWVSGLEAQKDGPLMAGADAIDRKDYASAEKILEEFLQTHPNHMDAVNAMLLLGKARVEMNNFDGAIDILSSLLKEEPKDWYAHTFLVRAYAGKGDWAKFDKEQRFIKAARDSNARGIDYGADGDIIEVLTSGGQQYVIKSYYKPVGPHHTRYVFLHIAADGNVTDLLTCDSDDGDQVAFKTEHPKDAASGMRRFSLDPWRVVNGNLVHDHMLRFYDGEPKYEVLRADVIKVLTFYAQQKDGKSTN